MKIPTRRDVTIFPAAADFRAWLEEHHDTEQELFVGYYRTGVPKTAMTYPESVLEALCFGWIDGITRRIDDEVRCSRFTPRRPASNWSALNIARVAELTAAGRMRPAGIAAFEQRDRRKDATYSYERPMVELDRAFVTRLEADAAAADRWRAETNTFRRQAADWVMSAKRPETRERRFVALLAALREGQRPRAWPVARADRGKAGP